MKIYLISSPEKLKEAVDSMKWKPEKQKVQDFATVWSATMRKQPNKPIPIKVTLELGRQAILFRERGWKPVGLPSLRQGRRPPTFDSLNRTRRRDGNKIPLGTMNLNAARAFAKGLVET